MRLTVFPFHPHAVARGTILGKGCCKNEATSMMDCMLAKRSLRVPRERHPIIEPPALALVLPYPPGRISKTDPTEEEPCQNLQVISGGANASINEIREF